MSTHQPMEEDDVDDFLYGSDAPEDNYGTTTKSANKKINEEDDEIYEQYNESLANSSLTNIKGVDKETESNENDEAMEEDQEDEDEEDSDDDLDIILEADDDQPTDSQQTTTQKPQGIPTETTTKTSNPLVNIKPGQQVKEASQTNNTTSETTGTTTKSSGGIDLEAVGEYHGQPITDVDLDIFEDKPWRKPGADITDYFNYGFNEVTWRAYCAKQKTMRDKKVTGNVDMDMQNLMGGMEVPDFMKMGMMMPMMEGGMQMGMMNPMMNPMMGLPPPPPPSSSSQSSMGVPSMGGPQMGSHHGKLGNRSSGSTSGSGRVNQNYGMSSSSGGSSRGSRR
ncbi:Fip1 motif-domain-containing protein [Halteromyces radiatus]|uniref:Fip1 motif-domain-containing protein n=1 Tax=Halteromyces radiatus TaxID=101107 RepID=UPI00221EAA6F|nr:Fip1 motif-domain-containing protein [Halteromyces radiatus]KAI8097575.1 Fip1 motif-domain-containing protein [Halteromyces radiatus]